MGRRGRAGGTGHWALGTGEKGKEWEGCLRHMPPRSRLSHSPPRAGLSHSPPRVRGEAPPPTLVVWGWAGHLPRSPLGRRRGRRGEMRHRGRRWRRLGSPSPRPSRLFLWWGGEGGGGWLVPRRCGWRVRLRVRPSRSRVCLCVPWGQCGEASGSAQENVGGGTGVCARWRVLGVRRTGGQGRGTGSVHGFRAGDMFTRR